MDNNEHSRTQTQSSTNTFGEILIRFIAAAVVLAVTAFFTPGFSINNFWALILGAIVLTIMDYLIVKITGIHASPFGKGFVGFVVSAIILYLTQFFVAGYSISWVGAIIGAVIYGIVDYFIPGEQQM